MPPPPPPLETAGLLTPPAAAAGLLAATCCCWPSPPRLRTLGDPLTPPLLCDLPAAGAGTGTLMAPLPPAPPVDLVAAPPLARVVVVVLDLSNSASRPDRWLLSHESRARSCLAAGSLQPGHVGDEEGGRTHAGSTRDKIEQKEL